MTARDEFLRVDRNFETLRQRCLDKMRDAILNFHFAPGDRLVERKLCERLNVSRTIVREVLRHLESEGLVEIVPHQGPIVARIDRDTAAQIYELRANLETIGARACAEHASETDLKQMQRQLKGIEAAFKSNSKRDLLAATTKFYKTMFMSGGKAVAWAIIQRLNGRINSLRGMTFMSTGRANDSMNEMQDIFSAIEARDPDTAEKACIVHVSKACQVALSIFDSAETENTSATALSHFQTPVV